MHRYTGTHTGSCGGSSSGRVFKPKKRNKLEIQLGGDFRWCIKVHQGASRSKQLAASYICLSCYIKVQATSSELTSSISEHLAASSECTMTF